MSFLEKSTHISGALQKAERQRTRGHVMRAAIQVFPDILAMAADIQDLSAEQITDLLQKSSVFTVSMISLAGQLHEAPEALRILELAEYVVDHVYHHPDVQKHLSASRAGQDYELSSEIGRHELLCLEMKYRITGDPEIRAIIKIKYEELLETTRGRAFPLIQFERTLNGHGEKPANGDMFAEIKHWARPTLLGSAEDGNRERQATVGSCYLLAALSATEWGECRYALGQVVQAVIAQPSTWSILPSQLARRATAALITSRWHGQ